MKPGKWTRRVLLVFAVWYILSRPGDAASNLRSAFQTAIRLAEVAFTKAAVFMDGLTR